MDERCDGCSGFYRSQNLKQTFKTATWNVRGLKSKVEDLTKTISGKCVSASGLQETKCDKMDEEVGNFRIITFDRQNVHHAMGFAVERSLEVIEMGQIHQRLSYIILKKRRKWACRNTEDLNLKTFGTNRKGNNLVVIDTYAPHKALVDGDESHAELFYIHLNEAFKRFRGMDCMITEDFNAKLGKQASMEAIGAHARGTRDKNGEYLQQFFAKINFLP